MIVKSLWILLGWTAVGLGAIGAVLPVLPTTPFLLLAAVAFGKGSPSLRDWVINHRIMGKPVRDWEAHGAIRRSHKITGCVMMALVFLASLYAGLPTIVLAVQAFFMAGAAVFIISRPTGPSP